MKATIIERPATFDRVDRVKWAVGHQVLRGDDKLWILGSDLIYEVNGVRRKVPTGFTTDGASIPGVGQVLTGWKQWDEPQRWAAIVHDYLYCERNVIKAYADAAFRALLIAEGANWWMNTAMYWAVKLGGGQAYLTDQAAGPMIYKRGNQ